MAISRADQAQVARSMQGVIGAFGTPWGAVALQGEPTTEGALARWGMREYGTMDGATFAAMQSVARRVLAANAMGEAIQQGAGWAPTESAIPYDPRIQSWEERYLYIVRVTHYGDDGRSVSSLAYYRSGTIVGADEVIADVLSHVDSFDSPRRSTRAAIRQLGAGGFVAVDIVSVGQRIRE